MLVILLTILPILVGYPIGTILRRALAERAKKQRLGTYVARRAAELRLEHEGEQRLLLAHHSDKERGGVYRSRSGGPANGPERSRSGPGDGG